MQETLYQVVCSGFSLVVKSSNAHITPPPLQQKPAICNREAFRSRKARFNCQIVNMHFDNLISSIISQSYALYIIYLK